MSVTGPETQFCLPSGFRYGAAKAAIKRPDRFDVALIAADRTCSTAGVFTQNLFAAAPVNISRTILVGTHGKAAGVVVNSGNANAATGELGTANAQRMCAAAAATCPQLSDSAFLVCSTGTIGIQLPMDRVEKGIQEAGASLDPSKESFHNFARAIMTTDTVEKIASAEFQMGDKTGRILGCAKGSGMMAPNMATLLTFIVTDVDISPKLLSECFGAAISRSLNCMTIDGDTSTNDTALVFASGASGLEVWPNSDSHRVFQEKLTQVLQSLTKQLSRDGEGATKLIEIQVNGAESFEQARKAGLAIGNSNLVKTAIYGRDANWGRIVCALGYSGVAIDPATVSVWLGPLHLFHRGAPLPLDEAAALEVLSNEFIPITVDLASGPESATVWTCDLTEKYIEINGSYRT